jgi:hypothetical protein
MKTLVENAKHVPSLLASWKPGPSADKDLAKHISELCIPTASDGRPSLLLHDLGEERNDLDRERVERIPDIFSFANHTCVTYHSMKLLPSSDLVVPVYSSTPPDPVKLGYSSRVCVVGGDSISLQSRIGLAQGPVTFGRL